jgi:hypothetical protein
LAGVGVDAELAAVLLERLGHRRRRRDRVPGADRGAAVDAAERRGAVAIDEDAVADIVARRAGLQAIGAQVRLRVVAAERSAFRFGCSSFSLPLYCSAMSWAITLGIHAEQRRERAEVHDVLEELSLARIV